MLGECSSEQKRDGMNSKAHFLFPLKEKRMDRMKVPLDWTDENWPWRNRKNESRWKVSEYSFGIEC